MTHYYTDTRRGLSYRIIGFIGEDDIYETYHGRSSGHIRRDTILHLLKNGNGRRYPDVKQVNGVSVTAQKPSKTREEVILPWVGDEDKPGLGGAFFDHERIKRGG